MFYADQCKWDHNEWISVRACWDWLVKKAKRMLIAVDAVDEPYKLPPTEVKNFLSELTLIGEMSGPRRIMAHFVRLFRVLEAIVLQ